MDYKKLSEVAEIIAGQSPSSSTYNNEGIGLPFYQGKADFGEWRPVTRIWCSEPVKTAEIDDILISVRAPVGPTNLNDTKSCIGRGLSAIRCKKGLITKYLIYYFRFIEPKLSKMGNGSTFSAITQSDLRNLQIPIPKSDIRNQSTSVQNRIAEILDLADMHRQKTKAMVEKYDALAQSLFLDMFGDIFGKTHKLGECCELNPKKSTISNLDKNTLVSFVPMAFVGEKGELFPSENRKISEVWNGFTFFEENDVVFAKITPSMENGKGAIMKNLTNQIGFGTTEFHVLRPLNGISNSYWIYYLTANPRFRYEASKYMVGSAGQKRVSTDYLQNFKVNLPPLSLQNEFAERIQEIEKQKELAKQALKKAEELFGSLLQKAFSGELVRE